MTAVVVHVDGFVGGDGVGGWAFVALREDARHEEAGVLAGAPSHVAEWTAVARALAWAEGALVEGDALDLRTDSALVRKGLSSRKPEMSGEAAELRASCRQALARLAQRGVKAKVHRIRREENVEADGLARAAALDPHK